MTLFVDMDEVIADTYGAHITLYNNDFKASLTRAHCMGGEVWQSVPIKHQESVRKHAHQPGFFSNLRPIEDSQEVLEKLNCKIRKYTLPLRPWSFQIHSWKKVNG